MEYRPILSEEITQWWEFDQYCFQSPAEGLNLWLERQCRLEANRSLFGADGRMLATMFNWPFQIQIDGVRIPVGGIAGVASVPENRRGGYVGELLRRSIAEMKEQGIPLSALYPFKQSFYRQFGWDVACAWLRHEIPIELLAPYRRNAGVVKRYMPGHMEWQRLAAIYDHWAPGHRGSMVRPDEWHWSCWVDSIYPKSQMHTALWAPSAGGEPEGYVAYRFDKVGNQDALIIRELVALTQAAEVGLWGYIANHDSQVKLVTTRTQRDYPLWHLLEHTYDVKSTLSSGWQLRLVDLKQAFEVRRWPADLRGSLTITVTDEQAAWNHGTWRFTFEAGHASLERVTVAASDLSTNVQTLAQLYAGFVKPVAAVSTGRLSAANPEALDLLGRALAGDSLFFIEFF
ncbi:MAG: enhanced intracellular survival protein Eis [Mycobacterium leprae]